MSRRAHASLKHDSTFPTANSNQKNTKLTVNLVTARHPSIDSDATRETKSQNFGLTGIVRRTHHDACRLTEPVGASLKPHYAAHRLVPYRAHSHTCTAVTHIFDRDNFINCVEEEAADLAEDLDADEERLTEDGQIF
jgi:hypothetical protein